MNNLICLLDNTFLGTVLAGLLLARYGLYLYKKQKDIDIKYEEIQLIKKQASLLFSKIEIVSNSYQGQINIYNGKNNLDFIKVLNYKNDDYFHDTLVKEIVETSNKISDHSNELLANLKIHSPKYDSEIDTISLNISKLIVYLNTVSVLRNFNEKDIFEIEGDYKKVIQTIKDTLQRIIK